jgi:hypothetical protein
MKNYKDLKPGSIIIYDNQSGRIVYDVKYTDSMKVNGMSLKYILEEFNQVMLME